MDRWKGRVAVITGTSSGIGSGIARELVQNGMTVIGLDKAPPPEQQTSLHDDNFHFRQTDLRREEEILAAFTWIDEHFGAISVMINNAGIATRVFTIENGITDDWRDLLDVNILALTICTRETIKSMRKYGITDGHIVNISSIVSHESKPIARQVLYCASKKAVMSISEGIRIELLLAGSKTRVTTICPGMVDTNIMKAVNSSFRAERPKLQPKDVAQTVAFCLQLPSHIQVSDLVVVPVGENFTDYSVVSSK